jgi:hypothetical protein
LAVQTRRACLHLWSLRQIMILTAFAAEENERVLWPLKRFKPA